MKKTKWILGALLGSLSAAIAADSASTQEFDVYDRDRSARVAISQKESQITVRFVREPFDLPDHVEVSFIGKDGKRKSVNLGATQPRILEHPTYQGAYSANQESFAGLEIRIPFSGKTRTFKTRSQ